MGLLLRRGLSAGARRRQARSCPVRRCRPARGCTLTPVALRLGRRLAGAGRGVRTRVVSGAWLRDAPVLRLVTAREWLIRRAGLSGCEPATLATVLVPDCPPGPFPRLACSPRRAARISPA